MEHWILTLTNDDEIAVKSWDGVNMELTSNEDEFLKFDKLAEAEDIRDQINTQIGAGTVGTSGPRR